MREAIVPGLIGHFCEPRRIVPPRSDSSLRFSTRPARSYHSVMSATTGFCVSGSNSVLFASARPATSRANSITASCMPRQMPRYGVFDSRAYWIALILPSVPRRPKPPGTSTASRCFRPSTPSASICSESMYSMLTFVDVWMAAWRSASISDLYDSVSSTYLPTMPIVTSLFGFSSFSTSFDHMAQVGRLRRELELFADDVVEALVVQHLRNLVDAVHVPHRDDRVFRHVREERNLLRIRRRESDGPRGTGARAARCRSRAASARCAAWAWSSVRPRWRCTARASDARSTRCCGPRRRLIWRAASRNGSDSMSPTVPPISTIATSGSPHVAAAAPRSRKAWISFVMCGMTWTVLPRYSPRRSLRITDS